MSLYKSFKYTFFLTTIFWVIKGFEELTRISLSSFGIYPRHQDGLIGVILAPFLHGDMNHLMSNTVPFLVLCTALLFFYKRIAFPVISLIWLGTGLGVWVLARGSYHIGASGVVYGFASFLFFSGLFRRDFKALGIALAVAILYGGLVYGVLPLYPGVSWESHLIGAIMGGLVAYSFRRFKVDDEEEKAKAAQFDDYKTGYRNMETDKFKYHYENKK
jgi:membrane associated rhomboid family serine protease